MHNAISERLNAELTRAVFSEGALQRKHSDPQHSKLCRRTGVFNARHNSLQLAGRNDQEDGNDCRRTSNKTQSVMTSNPLGETICACSHAADDIVVYGTAGRVP